MITISTVLATILLGQTCFVGLAAHEFYGFKTYICKNDFMKFERTKHILLPDLLTIVTLPVGFTNVSGNICDDVTFSCRFSLSICPSLTERAFSRLTISFFCLSICDSSAATVNLPTL